MSYLTYVSRRLLGDEQHEEVKGRVLGSGASALIAALPGDKGGGPPKAIVDHRFSLTGWQPVAVGAAVFITAFYLFSNRR